MKNKILTLLTLSLMLACVSGYSQEYTQTPVTLSTEMVRNNGKVYYFHVVQERQTLYSIARAYGVTIAEIDEANPDKQLVKTGLKKGDIIMIPAKESAAGGTATSRSGDEYFIHVVKWYEDIDAISRRYGVPVHILMKYNGLKDRKVTKRMKIKIPRDVNGVIDEFKTTGKVYQAPDLPETEEVTAPEKEETVNTAPVAGKEDAGKEIILSEDTAKTAPPADTPEGTSYDYEEDESESADMSSIFNRKKEFKALLMLPFGASSSPSRNILDFYSGALLAVRDLGNEGISTDLSVIDVAGGNISATAQDIRESDVVIGPVSNEDLQKVLSMGGGRTPVVSPLDQKASSLIPSNPYLIQAPAPYETQYEEIAKWVIEDTRAADKVIVISEKGGKSDSYTKLVTDKLKSGNIPFELLSYNLKERGGTSLADLMGKGTNRVVLTACDNESFVHDLTRSLTLISNRGSDVVLYSSSRIRTFNTIEIESLHAVQTHVAASYFIDYYDPAVKKFLRSYRALFNTEPSQFAFQGYDILSYFLNACSKYGRKWFNRLDSIDEVRMLQGDFLFARDGAWGGLINQGVRRVVYHKDYSIRLENR